MMLLPAVDVYGPDAVKFSRQTGYPEKIHGRATELVKQWCQKGAAWLHLVDLHGALGFPPNTPIMTDVIRTAREHGARIQIGGGIRSDEAIRFYLDQQQVERVLVSTRAIRDPAWLDMMAHGYPGRIVLSLDAFGEFLAVDGWKTKTEITTRQVIESVRGWPLAGFMYTNLKVEGAGKGIDPDAVKKFLEIADRPTVISGGITTLDEVRLLKELGAFGVILGSAIYKGTIDLGLALEMRE